MRRTGWFVALPFAATILGGCASAPNAVPSSLAATTSAGAALPLWKSGTAAFGMFVPSERPPAAPAAAAGGRRGHCAAA